MHERFSLVFCFPRVCSHACTRCIMRNTKHQTLLNLCQVSTPKVPTASHHSSTKSRFCLSKGVCHFGECHMSYANLRRPTLEINMCEADVFLESVPLHLSQGQLLPGGDTQTFANTWRYGFKDSWMPPIGM